VVKWGVVDCFGDESIVSKAKAKPAQAEAFPTFRHLTTPIITHHLADPLPCSFAFSYADTIATSFIYRAKVIDHKLQGYGTGSSTPDVKESQRFCLPVTKLSLQMYVQHGGRKHS
jgi:hypothetical protein